MGLKKEFWEMNSLESWAKNINKVWLSLKQTDTLIKRNWIIYDLVYLVNYLISKVDKVNKVGSADKNEHSFMIWAKWSQKYDWQ